MLKASLLARTRTLAHLLTRTDRHHAKLRETEDRELWMAFRLRQYLAVNSLISRALKAWRLAAVTRAEANWLTRGSLLQVR